MLSRSCTTLILLIGLVAATARASAIKGHQQQSVQRAEEQTRLAGALKSPVAQQPERSPKSVPAQQPILESSKKVYNDESIRRSVSQQQAAESAPVAVKSAAQVVESPAAPVVSQPIDAPVAVHQPAAAALEPAKVQPIAAAPVEPAKVAESAVAPAARPVDDLPPQSARSAPIKDELKPVEPAKAPAVEPVPVPVPVVAAQQQQAPIVVESKPTVPEPQVQPAPIVPAVAKSQPEPVVEPLKPDGVDAQLQAKKDEPVKEAEPIEVPAPDPGLVLSEPIDSTTKLLIDLDEHVQKFLPAEDKQEPAQPAKDQVLVSGIDYSPQAQPSGKSSVPLMPYSSNVESEAIVPPLPSSLDRVEKASGAQSAPSPPASVAAGQSATRQANHQHQNQQQVITQLLDQLDSLQNRIQDTINQLVARRRYVMSALLRPMGTYVRRVRTNLERLQNRVNQLQAAASSVGSGSNGQRPGGFVDAAAIETIRRRIDDISKRISDIVNRIRFSLTPTSAPLNSNGRK